MVTMVVQETITCEADQRHIDLLMAQCGLTGKSESKVAPRHQTSFVTKNPNVGPLLVENRLQPSRSACMRRLFLAVDRLDIREGGVSSDVSSHSQLTRPLFLLSPLSILRGIFCIPFGLVLRSPSFV